MDQDRQFNNQSLKKFEFPHIAPVSNPVQQTFMLRLVGLLTLSVHLLPFSQVFGYKWPGDPRHEALEKFIYEGTRPDAIDFFSALGNCRFRITPPEVQATTVAATWLRFNIGNGLKLTQIEYRDFPTKYVSNADIIAIGAAAAVATCGGPLIPLRTGRIDAESAGKHGVPEPKQDLQTHTEKFRLQGFNSTEMIELVACGHTMGGVESADFPLIVDIRPTDPSFPSVSAPFDNTTNIFDTSVVTQYLNGTTQNPLVVSNNVTARSDLRIFNSDGNVTMHKLSDPVVFQNRCAVLLGRMIDTVPAGVQLSAPIEVIPEIPHASTSFQIVNKQVTFLTSLRLAKPISDPFVSGSQISFHWCDRYGSNAGFSNRVKGSPEAFRLSGSPMLIRSGRDFRVYPFQAPIQASRSVSRFWWEIDQGNGRNSIKIDNEGEQYPVVQDEIIYAPTLSNIGIVGSFPPGPIQPPIKRWLFAVVGIRKEIRPTKVYLELLDYTFIPIHKTTLTNITQEFSRNTTLPHTPGYNLYSAYVEYFGQAPTLDFTLEVNGRKTTLPYQPVSIGHLLMDHRFIASIGRVDRVPYDRRPPKPPKPCPRPAALCSTH
ncbi:hypothetical protein CVT24_001088 [Panaeolus cyanescens]|uniref:Peroxidase n=1 Tax=Panaeolus cyanescens TaxID=181874 RepID=A0A409YY82_9AGAR|nr:hypothetical protein CVT24_001088 [Panaeolus cyanescens]